MKKIICLSLGIFFAKIIATGINIKIGASEKFICQIKPTKSPKRGKTLKFPLTSINTTKKYQTSHKLVVTVGTIHLS